MQNLRLNCMTSSNRNVMRNCHWVFGLFTTMHQFTVTCWTGSCSWLWICSTKPPYLQSRPHSQWLLSVQKSKILSSWNPVCRWWIAHSCCFWSVVLGIGERILFSRNKQLSRKMTKLHLCYRRLYSKMIACLKVCGSFLYISCKTFWTPLVS